MNDITREEFEAFEEVRKSGVTNMFAVSTVCEASGLDEATVLDIMNDYSNLEKKFK